MANMMQNTKDAAGNLADKAKDMASTAMDKTREVASNVADKAKGFGSTVANKADDVAGKVGGGLESAAGAVRDHSPQSGMLGSAASSVAGALESGGRYLREEGVTGMAEALTDMTRRNPIPALLIGLGVGYLLARALSSNS